MWTAEGIIKRRENNKMEINKPKAKTKDELKKFMKLQLEDSNFLKVKEKWEAKRFCRKWKRSNVIGRV